MAKIGLKINWNLGGTVEVFHSTEITTSEDFSKGDVVRSIETAMSLNKSLQVDLRNGNLAILGPEVMRNSVFEFVEIND